MSDLQRAFAKAKLASLPFEPPMPLDFVQEGEEEEEEAELEEGEDYFRPLPNPTQEDDSSSASSASSTGTIRPSPSKHLFARPKGSTNGKKALDQLPWSDFFAQELYLERQTDQLRIVHHAYLTPPVAKGPLFVTHHGAGSSGLSFAVCASEIRKALPNAGVLSLDAREHGETTIQDLQGDSQPSTTKDKDVYDLSLETLSDDLIHVIRLTHEKIAWPELPGLVLVGHSLGGAVVTEAAVSGKLGNAVLGYAVLDVVEGSAIDALQSMQSYLSTRPRSFPSLSSAIEWHTRTRTIRNPLSARVSVPSLLLPSRSPTSPSSPAPTPNPTTYTWRTNLAATQPFWENWFRGLSAKFLSGPSGKFLLLAGTDRLDKELMIGQMQGKYQLQVFPAAGHFIQEDEPERTAGCLVGFWRRNERGPLILPAKVGKVEKGKVVGGGGDA